MGYIGREIEGAAQSTYRKEMMETSRDADNAKTDLDLDEAKLFEYDSSDRSCAEFREK